MTSGVATAIGIAIDDAIAIGFGVVIGMSNARGGRYCGSGIRWFGRRRRGRGRIACTGGAAHALAMTHQVGAHAT